MLTTLSCRALLPCLLASQIKEVGQLVGRLKKVAKCQAGRCQKVLPARQSTRESFPRMCSLRYRNHDCQLEHHHTHQSIVTLRAVSLGRSHLTTYLYAGCSRILSRSTSDDITCCRWPGRSPWKRQQAEIRKEPNIPRVRVLRGTPMPALALVICWYRNTASLQYLSCFQGSEYHSNADTCYILLCTDGFVWLQGLFACVVLAW